MPEATVGMLMILAVLLSPGGVTVWRSASSTAEALMAAVLVAKVFDATEAGEYEVLADETSAQIKAGLSALYPELGKEAASSRSTAVADCSRERSTTAIFRSVRLLRGTCRAFGIPRVASSHATGKAGLGRCPSRSCPPERKCAHANPTRSWNSRNTGPCRVAGLHIGCDREERAGAALSSDR